MHSVWGVTMTSCFIVMLCDGKTTAYKITNTAFIYLFVKSFPLKIWENSPPSPEWTGNLLFLPRKSLYCLAGIARQNFLLEQYHKYLQNIIFTVTGPWSKFWRFHPMPDECCRQADCLWWIVPGSRNDHVFILALPLTVCGLWQITILVELAHV